MRIIGIDPGTAITGYGIIEGQKGQWLATNYGCIRTSAQLPLQQRLLKIYNQLVQIIQQLQPDQMAVEELFVARNTRTVMAVGQARGVILLAGAQAGLVMAGYTPLEVKQAVAGYGQADKLQVQTMVTRLLCLQAVPQPDDVADALAVALCHASYYPLNNVLGKGMV